MDGCGTGTRWCCPGTAALAVKVANLRRVQRLHPDGRTVHTFNAVQNAPMVAVNDLLRFRPVEMAGEWQGELAALAT